MSVIFSLVIGGVIAGVVAVFVPAAWAKFTAFISEKFQ